MCTRLLGHKARVWVQAFCDRPHRFDVPEVTGIVPYVHRMI
jgi:hypothetical protein